MRLLVCGGRTYNDRTHLFTWLKNFDREHGPITVLIHGGANGADRLADQWARGHGINVQVFPAEWTRLGNAAGPIRNELMLVEGKPDAVAAFPSVRRRAGGGGTQDMINRANNAGVKIFEVGE